MRDNTRCPRFFIPRWIATRTFHPSGAASRSVISNELDHEFITLDGDSSELWDAICVVGGEGISLAALREQFPRLPEGEIVAFLDELASLNLVAAEAISAPVRIQGGASALSQSSARYSVDRYVEPAIGGDNLEEEFDFQDWAISHGFLWSASWEMTYRCNESCVHCFNPGASHGPGERSNRKTAELSRDEATTLLAQLRGLGVFRLLLTGGEVVLRKDFFDIVAEARRLGFSVTIFTNGTLLDADRIERLASMFPHRVELTLYSTREKHDAITRLKGSFDKTVAAARALVERGVAVAIKTTVMRDTAFDHHELRQLCDEIGCEYLPDFNMSAGVDGARSPLTRLSLGPEELIRNAFDPSTSIWIGTADSPRQIDIDGAKGQPVCGAGRSLMSISPEGNISPCNSLPIYMGSVRKEGVMSVWKSGKLAQDPSCEQSSHETADESILSRWQSVVRGKYRVCGDFKRCSWCQKCPGMAYLETGDELAPSVSNCRTAAARMIAFDMLSTTGALTPTDLIDIEALRARYSDETALWSFDAMEQRISLDQVKRTLRERTKATALLNSTENGTGTDSRS